MRHGTAVLIALALFAGCAHKGKEAPIGHGRADRHTGDSTVGPAAARGRRLATHIRNGGTTSKIYQPQLESWDGFTLKGTAAVEMDQPAWSPYSVSSTLLLARQWIIRRVR